jgi:hypothetical protein
VPGTVEWRERESRWGGNKTGDSVDPEIQR